MSGMRRSRRETGVEIEIVEGVAFELSRAWDAAEAARDRRNWIRRCRRRFAGNSGAARRAGSEIGDAAIWTRVRVAMRGRRRAGGHWRARKGRLKRWGACTR